MLVGRSSLLARLPLVSLFLVSACVTTTDLNQADKNDSVSQSLTTVFDSQIPIHIYFNYEMDYSGEGSTYFSRAQKLGLWGTRLTIKQGYVVETMTGALNSAAISCSFSKVKDADFFSDSANIIIEIGKNMYFVRGNEFVEKGSMEVKIIPGVWVKYVGVVSDRMDLRAVCARNHSLPAQGKY